jgi:hypothetical protein
MGRPSVRVWLLLLLVATAGCDGAQDAAPPQATPAPTSLPTPTTVLADTPAERALRLTRNLPQAYQKACQQFLAYRPLVLLAARRWFRTAHSRSAPLALSPPRMAMSAAISWTWPAVRWTPSTGRLSIPTGALDGLSRPRARRPQSVGPATARRIGDPARTVPPAAPGR